MKYFYDVLCYVTVNIIFIGSKQKQSTHVLICLQYLNEKNKYISTRRHVFEYSQHTVKIFLNSCSVSFKYGAIRGYNIAIVNLKI